MMQHHARFTQGGFPAVINMLGEEISGRSDHIPTKDVTMPYHELTQNSRRRFGIWPYVVIYRYPGKLRRLQNSIWVTEMRPAATRKPLLLIRCWNWKGGSGSAQKDKREDLGSRAGLMEQKLDGLIHKDVANWTMGRSESSAVVIPLELRLLHLVSTAYVTLNSV